MTHGGASTAATAATDPATRSPTAPATAPKTQGHSARSFAYIFLDESGNFDFSANGTRYFLLTSVNMRRPFGVYAELENYKYDCIESGGDVEHFHCHDDRKAVRNAVFGVIGAHLDELRIDCLVVEKRKTRPPLQEDERLYRWSLGYLLRRVLSYELVSGASDVMVITDTIPVNQEAKGCRKGHPWCGSRESTARNEISHPASPVAFPLPAAGGRLLLLGDLPKVATRREHLV